MPDARTIREKSAGSHRRGSTKSQAVGGVGAGAASADGAGGGGSGGVGCPGNKMFVTFTST
jgi:hypothetical protein